MMKRIATACALILTLALLSGCVPAFLFIQSAPDEDLEKEMEDRWEDSWGDWSDIQDSWNEASDGKDHYWKILDAEGEETGAVRDEEQVQALDDLLSDDGRWGSRQAEEPDDPACSYIYCQEKTRLAGQDPDAEREYEELVRFTISASEDVVTMRILEELPSLLGVDLGDYLTFTIDVPAETAEALRNPAQFTE